MRRLALLSALLTGIALAAGGAQAQTSPAFGALPVTVAPVTSPTSAAADDMLLADYLGLLRQIAPAAEEGARTYLAAVLLRCARQLTTAELRQAFAQNGGNPTLMGLIRAARLQDKAARNRLVAQLVCPHGDTYGGAP